VGLAQDSQADVDRNADKRALVAGSLVGLVTLDLAESCDTGVHRHVDQSTGAAATALVARSFAENGSAETDGDADEILRGTRRGSRGLLGLVTLGLTESCDTGIHRNVDQSIGVAVAVQLIARSFAENASAEVDGEADEALSRS
jgi:hypothetical protein